MTHLYVSFYISLPFFLCVCGPSTTHGREVTAMTYELKYSHLSKVLAKHLAAPPATFLITKIAVTQQQLLCNRE